jgi:hypothetical protein
MPLRDHFHAPWNEENLWEGFHSAWVNTMVRRLNGAILPPHYRAVPQVHLGPFVETDLATFEQGGHGSGGGQSPAEGPVEGNGTAGWTPPEAVQTLEVDLPSQDVFEVRVLDERRGRRLVGVMKLVSPGNKDRAEHRRAFVAKCAAYLQEQVGLVVVDVVTARHANLHQDLLELLAQPRSEADSPSIYSVSYRNRKDEGRWRLDTWPVVLAVGRSLPTMPLWLAGPLAVPLDLEETYEETCQVLRIP